ncbi:MULTISPECIES: hypothetical protein [Pseudomonas syringae group]|uniref:hypothetical protein n=1 Tax=Pseudomonas syringae group TaxID=136849 RepID=UPI001C3196B9|nr:hypothetical protein [Pseudomonas viridiflava]QXG50053.1 hypothetical protein KTT57_13950 [Pseudomonas viridiflava]
MFKPIAVLLTLTLTGCAVVNPVGNVVDGVQGQHIEDTIPQVTNIMGSSFKYPLMMSINHDTLNEYLATYTNEDANGNADFIWQTDRSFYENVQTGSYVDTSQGRPIVVETYQPRRIPSSCTVTLKVNRQGIVQSSDVSGCRSIVPMSQVLFGW